MVEQVPGILARIVARKRQELDELRTRRKELEIEADLCRPRDFKRALTASSPAIIAEIKKASPSKGVFVDEFDPAEIARRYERGGAAAISVLTDREFFCGDLEDLKVARQAVKVPVIRKDFTLEDTHIVEAAAAGADAILLIAALLKENELIRLREKAEAYGIGALVEVHDASELDAAIGSGASIIGVNNRDLHTFEVRIETSLRLAEKIPDHITKVSESGIHSQNDVRRLMDAGFHAFLVGEHLMRSGDPEEALRALAS
jgi:indole-3-glycerol phosphate synthase